MRDQPHILLASGILCLIASVVLLALHAYTIREVRDDALPLAARVPQMERRLAILREQRELSALHASVQIGSQEEQVQAYVLPAEPDIDRLIAFLDILGDALRRSGHGEAIANVQVDDRQASFALAIHDDGLRTLLGAIDLAGAVTVADVLTADERALLLRATEEENPAGIVALEQFLSADLLRYARDPRAHEQQLLRSFSGPAFAQALGSATASSLLRDAVRILGGDIGTAIQRQGLWPLPFLMLDRLVLAPGNAEGWQRAEVVLGMHVRD